MSPELLARLLPLVQRIAADAGARILEVCRTGFEVREKVDHTPVTTADLAAHHVIHDRLSALDERWPVLSEETPDFPSWKTRQRWQTFWLVDPLDGTREFLRRREEYTVNIALIHEHQPVLGVIGAPALELLYYAHRGGGTFRIRGEQAPEPVRSRPFPAAENPVVASSRRHARVEVQQLLDRLGPIQEQRIGSSLKSCRIADGGLDLYPRFGPTSEWDTAAAQCIVEEAGGQLTDWRLQPLRYNTKRQLTNPPFLAVGDPSHDWSRLLRGLPVERKPKPRKPRHAESSSHSIR